MSACGHSTVADFACWLGNAAALVYFSCNFPQLYINFRRRSTVGFSSTFVVMKLFSISFQVANAAVKNSPFPIQLSGILLLLTSDIYVLQVSFYNHNKPFLLWFLMSFAVFFISYTWPSTITLTQWILPSFSLISYIPFLYTCYTAGTTLGISVFAQHLNFLGSILGLLMCLLAHTCTFVNWCFYLIGVIQASMVYIVAIHFHEMRFFDSVHQESKDPEVFDTDTLHLEEHIVDVRSDESENDSLSKER